jgi:hypothetical protein
MEKSKLKTFDVEMVASPDTTLYIKRYLRTKQGILFKMNDKCVQLFLKD